MKKLIVGALACVMLSGCISTPPNPSYQVRQLGDDMASCASLNTRLQEAYSLKGSAESKVKSQVITNVVLGVTGFFILVPWFFIDTGSGPSMDRDTASHRVVALQGIKAEKGSSL